MKKFLIISICAILAICFPIAGNAQSTGTGFYTQLDFSQPEKGFALLDIGHIGNWNIECTGIASVSSSNESATLNGNYAGKVWQFKSTTDSVITDNTSWIVLGSLVDSITVPANTYSKGETQRLVLQNITARWLFIGYDTTLSSQGYFANASGNGTISATAVPEPSSIFALGAMLSSTGLMLRRRKG